MGFIAEVRRELDHWTENLGEKSKVIAGDDVAGSLREELDKCVADPRIRIVVCGEWNTGKSALVNALAGTPGLLPTDVNPCSSYITVAEWASAPFFGIQRHGGEEAITHEQFLALTAAQEADPTIVSLRVGTPAIWPGEEVVLVDTPGLEDLDHTRSELTLNYLPAADVVVLVIAAPAGVRGTERAFVRNHLTGREVRRVVVALNKVDLLNEASEVGKLVERTRRALVEILPEARVLPVSALGPVRKWEEATDLAEDGGLGALKAEVLSIVHRERIPLIRKRFAPAAKHTIEALRLRIRAEAVMLEGTVAEAEEAVAKHRKDAAQAIVRLDDVFREAKAQIRAGMSPWLAEVPQRLDEMVREILEEVEALPDLTAVRAYVNDRVLDRRVAVGFRQLCHEFEQRLAEVGRNVAQQTVGTGLQIPSVGNAVGEVPVAEVRSWLRSVPEFVVNLLEALLLNPIVPGGILTAILARLGLDKIIKGIPLLSSLLPSNFLKNQLVSAIRSSLAEVPGQAEEALREATEQTMSELFQQIRSHLDRQASAVETGLEEARVRLSRERASVAARRAELAAFRLFLDEHGRRLETLVA